MNSRRSFLEEIAMLSVLAALAEEEGFSEPQDGKMSNFWDSYFDEAARDPTQVSRGSTDGSLPDSNKKVQLIHASDAGLRYPDTIPDSELPTDSDVVLTITPGHFRPAPDDHRAISKSKGAQVRLDCVQTRPIMNLLAPMAWSALAAWSVEKTNYTYGKVTEKNGSTAVDPKTGQPVIAAKMNPGPNPPDLNSLDFQDPNNPNAPVHNQVILMGGTGRMALNVSAVSANHRLQTVLDKGVNYASMIAPFFGFAPLAIPALKTMTTLLGAVFNHEAVIMNSMPQQILASQAAKKAGPVDMNSVKILSGSYIAVPTEQASLLKDAMDKLTVTEGWLVHQDTKTTVPVAQRALDPLVPPVTYMSMSFTVQSLAEAQAQKAKGG